MQAVRRTAVAVSAMALAAAGVVATSTTAAAEGSPTADSSAVGASAAGTSVGQLPTYRCEILDTGSLPRASGHACSAHDGAPEQGPISGSFAIENYRGMAVHCLPAGGYAQLPEQVEGVVCIEA